MVPITRTDRFKSDSKDGHRPATTTKSPGGEQMITKTERNELRSVVRQQLKVLRSEVKQRENELLAEIDAHLAEQYAEADARFNVTYKAMEEIVRTANRALGEVVASGGGEPLRHYEFLNVPRLSRSGERHREALREAAISELRAKVHSATLRLDRHEADLLRQLSLDALESEEAKQFLTSIPTVSALVPAVRMAELEAALEERPDQGRP
jgi:hypothetical protein